MKKILFVTNHLQYSDGVAKALLNLVNNIDSKEYEITICALFKKDKEFIKLFNPNIKIFSVFNCYFKGLTKLLKFIPKNIILKKIIKTSYDLVIAYQKGAPTELISSQKVNVPKIAFMHGYDTDSIKYHKNYNKIVCVSQYSCDKYKQIIDFGDKITFCHNVIEMNEVLIKSAEIDEPYKKVIDSMKKPIFCYIGRISEEKGIERVLNALSLAKKEGKEFSYILVGDGPEKERLEHLTQKLELNENVRFFGFQTNPYSFLKLSDCYVCSSFTEGLSTSCIEATILKKHIISTEVSGAHEIVENPTIGCVCKNDFDDLKQTLFDYIDGKLDIVSWEENKNKAIQKWDKITIIGKFETIIKEVIK